MFTIKTEPLGKFTQIKLINTSTGEYLGVIPDHGAALNSLVLRKNERLCDMIEGSSSYEDLISEGISYYKGMVLFPFPNRLKDGKYTFEDHVYQLPINEKSNNNALHGLVAESKFRVKKFEADDHFASLELIHDFDGLNSFYPFACRLTIVFTLTTAGMTCKTIVENKDQKNLPFGIGWHPYFKALDKIDSLELTIPSSLEVETDARMIPTGKYLETKNFATPTIIGQTNFDTCYVIDSKGSDRSVVAIHDPQNSATIEIWMDSEPDKYGFVQFYVPPHRSYMAVEPMTCEANAFNSLKGLKVLKSGSTYELSFGVNIK